jgi:hypothetical protein
VPRHDPFFKTLLRVFFSDFLSLAAPEVAAHLNATGAAFLDKEFFTDGPKGRRREVDLLARVHRRGSRGTLLVHVEIEARARAGIGRRLRAYSAQIQTRHGGAVLSMVLNLRAGKPGPRIETLEDELTGPQLSSFRYVSFGLSGCPAAEYLERAEPLAWGLAALMDHRPVGRPAHKLACLRRIAAAELTDDDRLLLVNCVETYLELNPTETAELAALQNREGDQEARAMTMTWADRMRREGRQEGIRTGREEGRREALRDVLLLQLGRRFGPLPEGIRQRVEAIASMERLTRLSEQILIARSLEEMELS